MKTSASMHCKHKIVVFTMSWTQLTLKAVNMFTLQTFSIKLPMDCDFPSLFNSMQVLTIMDPLSCDNAIYEDIKVESSHERFDIRENKCYGKVTSTAINKHEEKNHSYSKVIIMAFVIVFALLLGTAGACVAFALQITTLKSEIASLKMASLEHQLNTSIDMLYQQLSQPNASIDSAYQQLNDKVSQQLNTSIDMLYQQLSQQNASIDSAYRQLNDKVSQQLNTSIDMVYQQLSQQNASLDSTYQQLNTSLYEQLSQQNASLDSAYQQLNTSLYQQLSQQNASIDSSYQQLNTSINTLYKQLKYLQLKQENAEDNPAISCKDLYDTYYNSSGYYWIGEVGSAVRVYCNMSLTCGNLTGGWMRVANIDVTNTSQNCPSGLSLISSPKRVCDITSTGCVSTDFDIHGVQYSHICGRVIGYQNYLSAAFYYHSRGIDADYVNGVSLTHGQSPRHHIWTFAGALDESISDPRWKCPCINTNLNPTPTLPSFIGNDYFCDTAFEAFWSSVPNYQSFQVSDPLWDGEGCGPTNTCCYDPQREVNPPWFVKTLSSPTSDDIEMRLCSFYGGDYTTPIEIVELYVQ